jgi:hypothetical protein
MAADSFIDPNTLVRDLRLCVEYASRAGLLRDKEVIDALATAEKSLGNDQAADVHALMVALNEVTHLISPITVADLTFGRDPFSPDNQRRSRLAQLCLSLMALFVLFLIGCFMQALRSEQAAIKEVSEVQALRPELKLTSLRNIAQFGQPIETRSTVYDDFHERISDLREINTRWLLAYAEAGDLSLMPLFSFKSFFRDPLGRPQWVVDSGNASPNAKVSTSPVGKSANGFAPLAAASAAEVSNGAQPATGTDDKVSTEREGQKSLTSNASGTAPSVPTLGDDFELCAEDGKDNMRLPRAASVYPEWMQRVLADSLGDFCFQLKILSPSGDGASLIPSMGQLSYISGIKEKVSVRVTWFLPFFYGLLGAVVFVMRNVASVRTPSMEWFPMAMRLSLGGVAGIIIGWFSSASGLELETTSVLSVPFALAFLTGYGIDALFNILDRLNRAISDVSKAKATT